MTMEGKYVIFFTRALSRCLFTIKKRADACLDAAVDTTQTVCAPGDNPI